MEQERNANTLHVQLERTKSRQRAVALGCILGFISLGLFGVMVRQAASQPSIIRAQRVEIVDNQGQVRIILEVDSVTSSSILSLKDRQGKERMLLAVLPDGSSEIAFRDPTQRVRLTLDMLEAGSSAILIRDLNGQVLFRAP